MTAREAAARPASWLRDASGRAVCPAASRLRDAFRRAVCPAASRLHEATGQAAVEFVALLPIVVAVALGILQALAAGAADELADHAAQSGAVALAQGGDAAAAARRALPGWARDRLEVTVRGTLVRVRLTPPSLLPGLGGRLRASATADAGKAE